jgi:hypothetical protein
LDGGKSINKLMDGTFLFEKYKGKFIKITSYGLKFLPVGKYKIVYSERNIEELLDSMEKMAKIRDNKRDETKETFIRLNNMIKKLIINREDIEVLFVNYNEILSNPEENIKKILNFLGCQSNNLSNMIKTVDNKLYRQRR